MKRIITFILLGFAAAYLGGCESTGGGSYEEQIVLQGMMYVGQPMRIRLTHTQAIGEQYNNGAAGVSGASVRISTDTTTYTLTEESPDAGGYYSVANRSVAVVAGGHYSIHVEVGDHILDAETIGAGPTEILAQSSDTVEYGDHNNHLLGLRWQPDSLAVGYVAIIENLEPDWNQDYRAVSGNNGPDAVPWNLFTVSRTDDSLRLPWIAMGFTGHHRVRLLSCDRNLWNYMWTYYPPGGDVAPVTNVRGGLGIFSVGGADTTYFMLTDSVDDGPNGG